MMICQENKEFVSMDKYQELRHTLKEQRKTYYNRQLQKWQYKVKQTTIKTKKKRNRKKNSCVDIWSDKLER